MIKCDKCGENMIVDTRIVLTSIPPMYECYCPKCDNRKYAYCSECSENEKIDFDGYVGIGVNATKERCNAIPIEWLENWKKGKTSIEQVVADKIMMDYKYRDYWENENETNRR